MPRGKKQTAVVFRCTECGRENYAMQLNKKTKPEEFKKYCPTERKRTEHKLKDAKSSKK